MSGTSSCSATSTGRRCRRSRGPNRTSNPIRTLAGDVVTAYRPHDHRWHKGVQFTASPVVSPLPGAVGVSGLRVYDWPTADGLCGGSPHLHLTCAEAYVVVAGEGHVQTITPGGFARTPLEPGTVAWFTPGTIHRLVNADGRLQIVVIMQNSGLPEAGDAVFTFPPEYLSDAGRYARAAALDPPCPEEARRRRDLALAGFERLRDPEALEDFYRAAVRLKAPLFDDWERRWRDGALAAAEHTGDQLRRLRDGDWTHLTDAAVHRLTAPPEQAFGMCGRLDT